MANILHCDSSIWQLFQNCLCLHLKGWKWRDAAPCWKLRSMKRCWWPVTLHSRTKAASSVSQQWKRLAGSLSAPSSVRQEQSRPFSQACLQLTTITVEQCWHQQHWKKKRFLRSCLLLEARCNLWFPFFIVHEDFFWKTQSLIKAWSNHRCSLCILLQFTKRVLDLQLVFVFVIGVPMEQWAV